MPFTQIIYLKTNTKNKESLFNLTVRCLEKDSSVYRGWRGVNKQEGLLTGGGEEVGDGGAEGSSAVGDGKHAAVLLTPDIDGTGSGSLLDSIQSTFLKNYPVMSG